MRIVHISNFTMKWNGESFFTIPYKLNNGLTRLGHNVFSVCDRDIADGYLLGIRSAGKAHANRKVREICREIRPDLVILGHCTLIAPETVSSIRSIVPDARIAHWNCDPLFHPDIMQRLQSLAPLVDATFVTTAGPYLDAITSAGGRAFFMPNPVDRSIETERAFENAAADVDLLFMGSPLKERTAICDAIRTALPELRFQTPGMGAPSVFGAELFDLLRRSKMGLSLNRRDDVPFYASDRMSIMMGCGLLTFVDRRTRFHDIFGPDELVSFDGVDDLIAKLRYFQLHGEERRAIARRGWAHIHDIFPETRVAAWVVDATLSDAPAPPPWPAFASERRRNAERA